MSSETILAAAQIVAAYVSNNRISPEEVSSLIHETMRALEGESRPRPPVPIEESVTHDYIICLEDGERVQLLKRYLDSRHQMTPEQYKEKWGLPDDYPFVAKAYSERRSEIAKAQGLGKRKTT